MARIKIDRSFVQAEEGGPAVGAAGVACWPRMAPVATRKISLSSAGIPSESGGMDGDGPAAGTSGAGSGSGAGGGGGGAGGAGFLTAQGRGPGATGFPVSGSITVAGSVPARSLSSVAGTNQNDCELYVDPT
jgi:hypothetical protein